MFRGYLLNCFLLERGKLEVALELDGEPVELVQRPEYTWADVKKFEGEAHHTTDLVIRGPMSSDIDRCRSLHGRVAHLLMLASVSEVRPFGYQVDGPAPTTVSQSVIGATVVSKPLLDLEDGPNLKAFLESTWSAYTSLEESRKLRVAFEYLVLSVKNGQPLELKATVTFVLLEGLKYTYARSAGYTFKGGKWYSPGGVVGVKALLSEMLAQAGMQLPDSVLSAAVSLRNDLIHSGLSVLPFDELMRQYRRLQDFTREYFLRLLGYRGPYVKFSGRHSSL